jgi:hypothetical protein
MYFRPMYTMTFFNGYTWKTSDMNAMFDNFPGVLQPQDSVAICFSKLRMV